MKRDRHFIQKYLDNDLSDKDMKRFEADLEASTELQDDLELYREIDEALSDTEVLGFREQLTDLRREKQKGGGTGKKPIRFTKPWHYAATAAIALFLAIGLASLLDRPLDNQDLLKKYYKPYEVALINRSDNSTIDLILKNAEILYQRGEFEQAAMYFEKVLEEQPDLAGTNLYTGISYYELERFYDAKNSLNKVIEHNDNLYIEQAEWYLGLCFLALDENERAIRQFARIASGNSDMSTDARKVLKKIRR